MDGHQMSLSLCIYERMEHFWILSIVFVLLQADLFFKGMFVNGQVLQPVEANSSPSSVVAIKGSSVWLHWNYTYIGDGKHGLLTSYYNEQLIKFKSTPNSTFQVLAKRTGQNGALTLVSPTTVPFNGRVQIITSNSTLVIHHLQYNDSLYQFSSNINISVDFGTGLKPSLQTLTPNSISITINGIPDFITQPPSTFEVNEGSNLVLRIDMNGNPQPSAEFKWTHLPTSSSINVPSVQFYPFVYSSAYSLNNIDASYCGRILQTTIKNSIGTSSVKRTNVTVLLKLDKQLDLRAGKLGVDKCIEVKWNKVERGACFVRYDVTFKNMCGNYLHSETGYNTGEMKVCNLTAYANITDVQLIVSFKSNSRTVTSRVLEAQITSLPCTTEKTAQTPSIEISSTVHTQVYKECKISSCDEWNARDSAYIAVIAILVIIIIILSIVILKQQRKSNSETKHTEPGTKSQPDVMHYMDLQTRSNENELNYAKLQGDYEEIGQKNPHYVNA